MMNNATHPTRPFNEPAHSKKFLVRQIPVFWLYAVLFVLVALPQKIEAQCTCGTASFCDTGIYGGAPPGSHGLDSCVLVAFYCYTNGGCGWTGANWQTSAPIGTWEGVTTAFINGEERVVQLDLSFKTMSGTLPAVLADLFEIQQLRLANTGLEGPIPGGIGQLTKLTHLVLDGNNFSGTSLPPQLANLTNLQELSISNSGLMGDVPAGFSGLTNLHTLQLNQNNLTGNLNWLTGLTNLTHLDLSSNFFSDELPDGLQYVVDDIQYIHLNNNSLTIFCWPEWLDTACDADADFSTQATNPPSTFAEFCADGSGSCCPQPVLASNGPVCTGDTLLLSDTGYAPVGSTWAWSGPLGFSAPVQNPVVPSPSTGTYAVTVTGNGCTKTASIAVTVAPQAVASFTTSANGLSVSFSNTSTNATAYSWDFGDGSNSAAAGPAHTYATAGSYTVCLVAAGACPDTACATFDVGAVSPVLAFLPGGGFTMGCANAPACEPDELPPHPVTIDPFYIGQFEVTQAQYRSVVGTNPSLFGACGDDCPVESVSWFEALVFCNKLSQAQGLRPCYYADATLSTVFLGNAGPVWWDNEADGYRLPTEAEWEFAAQGSGTALFAGSDNADDIAWYAANSGGQPHTVGTKSPNGNSLHDLSGNVWEWCWDVFENQGYQASAATCNPLGSAGTANSQRVIRGGDWAAPADSLRVANRSGQLPSAQSSGLGFRVARRHAAMVLVPGGSFQMGCTPEQLPDCGADENPVHGVTLAGFYLAKNEVTQVEWQSLMAANPSQSISCGERCPVENVSWYDALVYCNRRSVAEGLVPSYYADAGHTQVFGSNGSTWSLPNAGPVFQKNTNGYRLPTEAEWEFAARGGLFSTGKKYPGSNDLGEVAWWNGNSGAVPHPAGEKKPNELGLFDLGGNVAEWCSDWYGNYPAGISTNPAGPAAGTQKILRGGAWDGPAPTQRTASRETALPSDRNSKVGFRLCRSL